MPGAPVPNNEIIVIGNPAKQGNFILRPGVDTRPIGAVTEPGVSASLAVDLDIQTEIPQMFGRPAGANGADRLSGAFVEDVRAAGFDVVYAPTERNPRHVRIVAGERGFGTVDDRSWLEQAFDLIGKLNKPKKP